MKAVIGRGTGRSWVALLLVILWGQSLAFSLEPASRPSTTTSDSLGPNYKGQSGTFEKGLASINLQDSARHKSLAVRVHYPKADKALPVVVFSHGFLANNDDSWPLIDWWVQHGYVVIRPEHQDARRVLGHKPTEDETKALLQKMLQDQQAWQNRARDIALIFSSLKEMGKQAPELEGRMDDRRIAIVGHSLGAHTAGLLAGATIVVPGQTARVNLADQRVSAVILIAGQGAGAMGLDNDSWLQIRKPMMVIGGSKDPGATGEEPQWRMDPFRRAPSGDHYSLFIQDAKHMSYTGRWSNDAGEKTQAQNEMTVALRAGTLAFLDAYLKGDSAAREYLSHNNVSQLTGGRASLSSK